MTDREKKLLDEIKNGNVTSFELVFKSYYTQLCKYAKSMVFDNDISGDIVKDVFIYWWQNKDCITINSSITGYLYKSIHNRCINYIKRVIAKNPIIYNSELTNELTDIYNPVETDAQFINLEMQELLTTLENAVNSLPKQQRTIFILSRREEKSHSEISAQLGISKNTVKVQIYKALLKIKDDLKKYIVIILLFITQLFY